ncbi:transglycosylase family protein [Embleya sp. NPDC059237]|uniref:transglycosylase family protein n=1 Tax=Embleya sp. NPDC059237 TaxID=3346784 RepID=UPI00367A009C
MFPRHVSRLVLCSGNAHHGAGRTRRLRGFAALDAVLALPVAAIALGAVLAGPAQAASVATWDKVARCESGGNWSINTGNGHYGGLQFTLPTWRAHGGKGMPHHASKAEQIRIAEKVLANQGPGAWPTCGRRAGLR